MLQLVPARIYWRLTTGHCLLHLRLIIQFHAVARMYMSELRQDHAELRWTAVYGVYHDRFRRIDGQWWFVSRNYSSLGRPARDIDTFEFPTPEPF